MTGHTPLRVLLDLGLDDAGIIKAIVRLATRGLIVQVNNARTFGQIEIARSRRLAGDRLVVAATTKAVWKSRTSQGQTSGHRLVISDVQAGGMNTLPTPTRTPRATQVLKTRDAAIDRLERALLTNVDGHRNVIELESFARAIGLAPDVLERLRQRGFIRP